MGVTPSHSPRRQVGEAEEAEMQPEMGWSGERGRIRLVTVEVEEEAGYLAPVKEKAAGKRTGSLLWHFLWPRAGVSGCPIDR